MLTRQCSNGKVDSCKDLDSDLEESQFTYILLTIGHSRLIQQGSRIDVLKSSSNFYNLIVSMREVFSENFCFTARFSLTLWLFKV